MIRRRCGSCSGRYFERMKVIVERHGGHVEKFIGDAVMAVFGVPLVHEDDALRAVRAALEMREALPELGLEGRIGLMTGEVVTGTEERLATGDAVNVAARLEQAAQPGEVLIGQPTFVLVREAVEVEPVEPLVLKGKAEPVPAYRLLRVGEVGAAAWGAVCRARARARARPGGVGAGGGRAAVRAGHGGRRCGRRQVAAGRRSFWPRSKRASSTAAASPTGRGSPTGRSSRSSTARHVALRRGRGSRDWLAAWGERGGDIGRGDRLGFPQDRSSKLRLSGR